METYFKNLTPEEGTPAKLLQDLRVLREDTEELFRAAGGKMAAKSKEKFIAAVDRLRENCARIQGKAVAGAKTTNRAIQDYPYSAVGLALGLGLLVGVLATRK
ncbi:glycine zipper domain-containing protein [Pedosphaera parvula]|uniref:DUF883 domain-containing protein n=1 Tax=Pedosphaera parvula (strain Ellin514) TaxID=320771 RepID=B9XB23_PEDPL|nr:DUF883 family protein [Pedosphaera parvula]EEF62708.1 protein of unknown function DUF883 ElaB [Pedosphaera parvula Ellin514]